MTLTTTPSTTAGTCSRWSARRSAAVTGRPHPRWSPPAQRPSDQHYHRRLKPGAVTMGAGGPGPRGAAPVAARRPGVKVPFLSDPRAYLAPWSVRHLRLRRGHLAFAVSRRPGGDRRAGRGRPRPRAILARLLRPPRRLGPGQRRRRRLLASDSR